MENKYNEVIFHVNEWHWGFSVDIVKIDGTAMVCVEYDKQSSPKTGYICGLSVISEHRKKGIGAKMMKYALLSCKDFGMTFARLRVAINKIWLQEWYEKLGFKELARNENEIEMIKEL